MSASSRKSIDISMVTHLAQVFLDGELSGTTLEGSRLDVTEPHISSFLAWLKKTHKNSEDQAIANLGKGSFYDATDKNLNSLLANMQELVKIEKKIMTESVRLKDNLGNQELDEVVEQKLMPFLKQVGLDIVEKSLAKGEVFFPGGWTGIPGTSGHQMIYRLKIDKTTNKAIFYVHNSGAGIRYHGSVTRPDGKPSYYPVYAFSFNYDGNKDKLSTWLSQLLKPQALPIVDTKKTYQAEDLYENIIRPAISWLHGERIPAAKLAEPTLGGRDGTCVFKSLTQMMQTHFKDKSSYRRFYLAYRLYLLKHNIDPTTLESTEQAIPGHQKLLKACLANTVRMLDEDLKPYVKEWKLHSDDEEKIHGCFKRWQKDLSVTLPKGNVRVVTDNEYLPEHPVPQTGSFYDMKMTTNSSRDSKDAKDTPLYEPEKLSFVDALKALNTLPANEASFCEFIKRFCFVFTDSQNKLLDGSLTMQPNEQDALLDELEKLLQRYSAYRPEPTPHSVPIYLSLMSLMDRLAEEGTFSGQGQKLSCVPLYADDVMSQFIRRLSCNPFLSSRDATLDTLYKRVTAFYEAQKKEDPYTRKKVHIKTQNIEYYCSIIDAAPPNEKEYLKAQWARDSQDGLLNNLVQKEFPDDLQYCYSYLKQSGGRSSDTPTLNALFKRQEKMEKFLQQCASKISVICDGSSYRESLTYNKNDFHTNDEISVQYSKTSGLLSLDNILLGEPRQYWREGTPYISGMMWLLKPSYLQQNFAFKNTAINTTLTSHYDGNGYSSLEVPFNAGLSTFLPNGVVTAERRQYREDMQFPLVSRSDEDRLESTLQRLRISSRCQAVLLLGELMHRPGWLINEEFQQYIELTLFQPGVLLQSSGTEIMTLLERLLIQNRFNKDPSYPEKAEWFLLKLGAGISSYLLQAMKENILASEDKVKNSLLDWQGKTLDVVTKRLANPAQSTSDQRECHSLKLRALLDWETKTDDEAKDKLTALSDSYLRLMFLPHPDYQGHMLEVERLQVLLERANKYLAQHLNSDSQCAAKIPGFAIALLKEKNWAGDWQVTPQSRFPLIVLQDEKRNHLKINMATRSIKQNDQQLCYLPLSLMHSAEYRELFGSQSILTQKTRVVDALHQSGDCYSFNYLNHKYRVLHFTKDKQSCYFQKEINGVWYTLAAPSEAIAKHLGFAHALFDNVTVPSLFEQAAYRVWAGDLGQTYIIENRATQKICYEQTAKGELYKRGESPGFLTLASRKHDNHLPTFLLRFESRPFIETIESKSQEVSWHLPRYGLSFIRGNDQDTYETADKQYSVQLPLKDKDIFGAGLILKSKDPTKEDLYIIPLQPFYQQQDEKKNPIAKGTHRMWVHDFSNYLARVAVNEIVNEKLHAGWAYSGSECYLRFPLQQGKIVPSSAADQIYLAYLYLAHNRPKKALQLLKNCQYQGSAEEMERLWWIITMLPANCQKPLMNSRVIAVQMHVLYAMARNKQQFPSSVKITPLEDVGLSNTQLYRQKQQKELHEFIKTIDNHIEDKYDIYVNRFNNIPKTFRLKEAQENFLLSTYQHQRSLAQETLKAEASASGLNEVKGAPPYEGILGTRYLERLKPHETNLSFYPSITPDETEHPVSCRKFTIDNTALEQLQRGNETLPEAEAIQALSPWISLENYLKYFVVYYRLAREANAQAKMNLTLFCRAIMTRYLDDAGNNAVANSFVRLANILWVALHAPEDARLPKKCSEIPIKYNYGLKLDAVEIIDYLTDACSKISSIPGIKINGDRTVYHPHTVSAKPVPGEPVVTEVKEIKKEIIDFLEAVPEFKKLHDNLQGMENDFEEKRRTILLRLKPLSSLKLDAQNGLFAEVDAQLLKLQKDCQENQCEKIAETKISPQNKKALAKIKKDLTATIAQKTTALAEILKRRQTNLIKEMGKQQEIPTVESLQKNYAKAKTEDYKAMGIREEDLATLEQELQALFAVKNAEKRFSTLIEAVSEYEQNSTADAQKKLTNALLSKDLANRKHEILFQYIKELSLYPEQARMLTMLAETNPADAISYVLQLIMGGGKTKVIMPLLLYLLADGVHLPIVMVPDMMLNTCFKDLRATSFSVFGQEAFLFHFDREQPSDAASLQHIYETLATAIAEKQYMVATASSMQSLDLKYWEIMYNRTHPTKLADGNDEQTEVQLQWLAKILNLMREKGVVAPDEAHQLFHIRKELNYGIGPSKVIDFNIVDVTVSLYAWMNSIEIKTEDPELSTLRGILQHPNKIPDEAAAKAITDLYVTAIGDEKQQPAWVKPLLVSSLKVNDLQTFLRGKDSSLDNQRINKALDAYPLIKAKWLLLREEFINVLPLTLRQKLHENYGPADDGSFFAIPYRANNVPTPYVFANFLEVINYTSQMLYCDGVSLSYIKNIIRSWQEEARLDRKANPGVVSPAERMFDLVFNREGGPLLNFEMGNTALIEALHEKFKHQPLLIQQVLKDSLSKMKIDLALLRQNTLNLASMFLRIYAFSATPGNYRTFHSKIRMALEYSLLIESRVKDYLKTKKTAVKTVVAETAEQFLDFCIHENDNMRALLDCGGRLRGKSNLEVATILGQKLRGTAIRYVLFYQGDDLYAWSVKDDDKQVPKKLSGTDEKIIYRELGDCPPSQRFTYYDQEHTLGGDIHQDDLAWAVLTADIKTQSSAYYQAAMRMRGLGKKQQIVVALEPAMTKNIPALSSAATALDTLFELLENNQKTALEEDHFRAALKKIDDLFREDLRIRILNEKDAKARDALFLKAERFFIDIQNDEVLALFNQRSVKEETAVILKNYGDLKLKAWQDIFDEKIRLTTMYKVEAHLTNELAAIQKEAIKVCALLQDYQQTQSGTEMQQQQQQQNQKQKEVQKITEREDNQRLLRKLSFDWIKEWQSTAYPDAVIPASLIQLRPRQLALPGKKTWTYDAGLYASPNFLYSFKYQDQDDIYTPHMEPCTALFFSYGKDSNTITASMLCPEEAQMIQGILDTNSPLSTSFWLTDLNGNAFGRAPSLSAQENIIVDRFLEQAAFFNGRADILAARQSLDWLSDQGVDKMDFIETIIKPALSIPDDQFKRLQNKLYKLENYVEDWAKNPKESLSLEHWVQKTPKGVKERFEKLLIFLEKARDTVLAPFGKPLDFNELSEALSVQDALIVDQYQQTLLFLRDLNASPKNNQWSRNVADYFTNNINRLSLGFLDYCLPMTPVALSEKENHDLMREFKEEDVKIAWFEQLLAANSMIGILSFQQIQTVLETISDNQKSIALLKKALVAKAKGALDAKALFIMLDNLTGPFTQAIQEGEDENLWTILALKKLKIDDNAIVTQAIVDDEFCDIINHPQITPLLTVELLKHLLDKGKDGDLISTNVDASSNQGMMSILKARLFSCLSYFNGHSPNTRRECMKSLCIKSCWQAVELLQAYPALSHMVIKSLYDHDLSSMVCYLAQHGLGRENNLATLNNATIYSTLKTLQQAGIHQPSVIAEALQNEEFRKIVLTLRDHKNKAELIQQDLLGAIVSLGSNKIAQIQERIAYLMQVNLLEANILQAILNEDTWAAAQLLHTAYITDVSLIQKILLEPALQKILPVLIQYGFIKNGLPISALEKRKLELTLVGELITSGILTPQNIHLIEDDLTWRALKVGKDIDKEFINEVLTNPPFQNIILFLADKGISSTTLSSHFLRKAKSEPGQTNKLLSYFNKQKLLTAVNLNALVELDAWPAVSVLEEAKVSDNKLLEFSLQNSDFQSFILDLVKTGFSGNRFPQALLSKHIHDLPVAKDIFAILNTHHLFNDSALQQLIDDQVWAALAELKRATLDNIKDFVIQALSNPTLCKAKVILRESNLDDDSLLNDVKTDHSFRDELNKLYLRGIDDKPQHLLQWTIDVIRAINDVRKSYAGKSGFAVYMNSVNSFAKEAIKAVLKNDRESDRTVAKKAIAKDLVDAAYKHLAHRHLIARVLADVFLTLSILGLLVLAGRKLSGRTFFFSSAKTCRQENFEKPAILATIPAC